MVSGIAGISTDVDILKEMHKMSRLPDEQWVMIQDSIDKKNVARSSRGRRTHCGKGGSVKFPSDYLTRKELKAMNGEVKSYRLNEPMTWDEFKALPDDIKVMYIKGIREKYHVPNNVLAEAMKASYRLKTLGLGLGKAASGESKKWHGTLDATRFMEWWYGPDRCTESTIDICEKPEEESKTKVETSIEKCIPAAGHLSFDCVADEALNMVKSILTGKHVHIVITWDSEEDE